MEAKALEEEEEGEGRTRKGESKKKDHFWEKEARTEDENFLKAIYPLLSFFLCRWENKGVLFLFFFPPQKKTQKWSCSSPLKRKAPLSYAQKMERCFFGERRPLKKRGKFSF